jgi:hypothetical protein
MRKIITTWSAIILLAGGILGVAAVFSADCSGVKDCFERCECNYGRPCVDSCGGNVSYVAICKELERDCIQVCH